MKIIKHGNPLPSNFITIYRFHCSKCGCIFEMSKTELMMQQCNLLYTATTKCPECDNLCFGTDMSEPVLYY